jgi:hypothetical protein
MPLHTRDFMIFLLTVNSILIYKLIYAEEQYCKTVMVRTYAELDVLNNCTVVIGSVNLMFSMFGDEDYTPEEINKRKLPLRYSIAFI